MTQKQMTPEILTDNKLIAEFMGLKPYEDSRYGEMWPDPTNRNKLRFHLQYHSSWDWQIPVWCKIGHLMQRFVSKNDTKICNVKEYRRLCDNYESAVFTNNTDKGFKILVESIKWYNTQNQ